MNLSMDQSTSNAPPSRQLPSWSSSRLENLANERGNQSLSLRESSLEPSPLWSKEKIPSPAFSSLVRAQKADSETKSSKVTKPPSSATAPSSLDDLLGRINSAGIAPTDDTSINNMCVSEMSRKIPAKAATIATPVSKRSFASLLDDAPSAPSRKRRLLRLRRGDLPTSSDDSARCPPSLSEFLSSLHPPPLAETSCPRNKRCRISNVEQKQEGTEERRAVFRLKPRYDSPWLTGLRLPLVPVEFVETTARR